jgi:hypothetical protein
MKQITFLATLLLLVPASSYSGGLKQLQSSLPDGTVYTYEVRSDSRDQWDPDLQESPPLAPGTVITSASVYMEQIPLPEDMGTWELMNITLEQISSEPEHWIYIVRFIGEVDSAEQAALGPLPWFAVLVRMDGTIPAPVITYY